MRSIRGISLMLLTFVMMVGIVPTPVSADPVWPVNSGMTIHKLVAMGEDEYVMLNCDSSQEQAQYIRDGIVRNSVGNYANSSLMCAYSTEDTVAAPDGSLFFNTTPSNTSSRLVIRKNGREVWSTDTTSPTNCLYYNSSTYTNKQMFARSISVGADGEIYAILIPGVSPAACQDRLVKIDSTTGTILNEALLTDSPPGNGTYPVDPMVWTYEDKLVVVDNDGLLREYDYDLNEDVSARYQFTVPSGHGIYKTLANSAGTVYAVTSFVGSGTANSQVLFHKDDGTTGAVSGRGWAQYNLPVSLKANGSVAITSYGSYLYFANLSTGLFDTVTFAVPLGYSNTAYSLYAEDENGVGVIVRRISKSNGDFAVSVDLMDSATQALTNLLLVEKDAALSPSPMPSTTSIDQSISGGYLYLPICLNASNCSTTTKIYKVELPGFGEPMADTPRYNTYESQERNYVAMGDSFSSGEGNPDFTSWTDRNGVNECHRSQGEAYPTLLANDSSLDLNLVDFVACSGATTDDVLYNQVGSGQWGEGAQVNALSEDTEVVTITIGGNDVGFRSFATNCALGLCNFSTQAYDEISGKITNELPDKLDAVFDRIDALVTSSTAKVYVIGYPHIAPPIMPTGPNSACSPLNGQLDDLDPTKNDGATVRAVIDQLNGTIKGRVDERNSTKFIYVDPNNTGSPFIGHDWCESDRYFQIITLNELEYSFHPNVDGHEAFESIIAGYM